MSTRRMYEILAVDDNEADLRLIQEAFAECPHLCHLTCTNSVEAAVQTLQAKTFDIVLSDMGPEHDGIRLIRVIRGDDRLKATPVIVLSGMVDPSPAYEAGANAFVSKCADLDTFFARVRDLMHFWLNVAAFASTLTKNLSAPHKSSSSKRSPNGRINSYSNANKIPHGASTSRSSRRTSQQ